MSLAQTYFNANADRLNGTATQLTVVGTLFVTWTLITGFFGQNFAWLVKNVSSQARLPALRRRRPRRAHASCSGRCSGSSAATGSDAAAR